MKTLAICQGGLVRSVALVSVLRYGDERHDAIAYGVEKGQPKTMKMLCDWADHVVVMQKKFKPFVVKYCERPSYNKMVSICDVGPDIWSNPFHPDLLAMVTQFAVAWKTVEYADGFSMKF